MFSRILQMIRQVIHRMIPYKSIEQATSIETPLSTEMAQALDDWYDLYRNMAPWRKGKDGADVKSLNLASQICSTLARQIVLEMKWSITGGEADENGEAPENERSKYLKAEFEKLIDILREKLEIGLAAGGMTIKPYPGQDGHIYFDFTADWSLYPISFGDNSDLTDVIFRDVLTEGKTYYTRLERHVRDGDSVTVTQQAYRSTLRDYIGTEVPLSSVPRWASLEPTAEIKQADGQLFGWYKVAAANCIDVDSPMGVSAFARAIDAIHDADVQYSRLLWEYEGGELAIDVDPMALKEDPATKELGLPQLNRRLFRGVDAGGEGGNYNVFAPAFRDAALINGLNQILRHVEDLCGLSRGSISDPQVDARTATELKIAKQQTYSTIADNQRALEACLRDVIRAMDKYATLYNLAPAGDYEVSFDWDDSILTDSDQQLQQRLLLATNGMMGRSEMRQWFFGETKAQADAALQTIRDEQLADKMNNLQAVLPNIANGGSEAQ